MVVEIKNLVKRYNDFLAVDNVSLNIGEGEIYGLLGPNGAGKTTTINTLIGLIKADNGEINIHGRNINKYSDEVKREIGIVPQEIAIYDELTAMENVTFFARLYGLRDGLLKERVKEALDFTGLWDRRNDISRKFSGGMKRRLNIACSIAHHPKLIIMDEPTVGIDPQSRNHILESVRELNRKGSTIIYTSHYMEEVEELCNKIAIMDHGKVIADGTKDELKNMVSVEDRVEIELSAVNYTVVDNVKKVTGVKDCIADNGRLRVSSHKDSKNLSRIIDCIVNADLEIIAMNIEKPTLETVFLTLTGRTLRD